MKVLSLVSSLDPTMGGTQSAATNILIATQRAGVEQVVATAGSAAGLERARGLIESLEREGIVVESFPNSRLPLDRSDRWGLSPPLAKWVIGQLPEFDLVHAHGVWGGGSLSGLLAARLRRKPLVVTAHESLTRFDIDDSRSRARRRQKLWLKRAYLRWTTLFLLNSRLEVEDSLPSSERHRARAVHHPVVDESRPFPRKLARGGGRDLRVGFLGRVHPKKNLEALIDAVAELPEHVQLVVAGDGEGAPRAREQVAAHGISARVTWLGFVDPARRDAMLAEVDVLAMPSTFESFGMSAAEAMVHGVPVVVSERTGITEVIRRHGGGVIAPPEARAIAGAIRRLDADRASLARLGSEAQAAVKADLTFSSIGKSFTQVYDEALELVPQNRV